MGKLVKNGQPYGGGGSGSGITISTASDVVYNNTVSGLQAENVQDALDELEITVSDIMKGLMLTITADGWVAGENGTYTYEVAIDSLTGNELLQAQLYDDGTVSDAMKEAFDLDITRIDTYEGKLVLTADKEITETFVMLVKATITGNTTIIAGQEAADYDPSVSYNVGDYVLYESDLYKCIEAITGAFDATKFTRVSLASEVTTLSTAVGDITTLDENITATDLVGAVNETFQLGNERKEQLVSSLIARGVTADMSETWAELIAKIPNAGDSAGTEVSIEDIIADSRILAGYSAYDKDGNPIEGVMKNNGAVSHTLPINSTYTIPEGYHDGYGTVSQSIHTVAEATITPGTSSTTIAAGQYLSGAQTIVGDANLVSANIKSGVSIFGVTGDSNVIDTSEGDADASHILRGKKAAVDGTMVTGTMTDYGNITQDASSTSSDDTYTYMSVPNAGYYDQNSKLRATGLNTVPPFTISQLQLGNGDASACVIPFIVQNDNYTHLDIGTISAVAGVNIYDGDSMIYTKDSGEDLYTDLSLDITKGNVITIEAYSNSDNAYAVEATLLDIVFS